ncbi:MAG: hypothetical protein ABEH43_06910, partial [Flavobacteriales bacterium]
EDELFQMASFSLIFMNSGEVLSIDSYFHINYLFPDGYTAYGLNFFINLLALIMFSAGLEKIFSPIWQKGLGFYYFIGLPHLRSHKLKCYSLNWITIGAELSLLMGLYFKPTRILSAIILLGFGISLFTIVDLSFIGQLISLSMLLILSIDFSFIVPLDLSIKTFSLGSNQTTLLILFTLLWIGNCVRCIDSQLLSNSLTDMISRYSAGASPMYVFTERNVFGLYIFRLNSPKGDQNLLPDFKFGIPVIFSVLCIR